MSYSALTGLPNDPNQRPRDTLASYIWRCILAGGAIFPAYVAALVIPGVIWLTIIYAYAVAPIIGLVSLVGACRKFGLRGLWVLATAPLILTGYWFLILVMVCIGGRCS
jgi:hypothetical protein